MMGDFLNKSRHFFTLSLSLSRHTQYHASIYSLKHEFSIYNFRCGELIKVLSVMATIWTRYFHRSDIDQQQTDNATAAAAAADGVCARARALAAVF